MNNDYDPICDPVNHTPNWGNINNNIDIIDIMRELLDNVKKINSRIGKLEDRIIPHDTEDSNEVVYTTVESCQNKINKMNDLLNEFRFSIIKGIQTGDVPCFDHSITYDIADDLYSLSCDIKRLQDKLTKYKNCINSYDKLTNRTDKEPDDSMRKVNEGTFKDVRIKHDF